MRSSTQAANPELDELVKDILREDSQWDRTENRSVHRDSLVRPVMVQFKDGSPSMYGFTKNISTSGVGVICEKPVAENTFAYLTIDRIRVPIATVFAECVWCKKYVGRWYMSGWRFIKVQR
jgi:hypothetical protein